VPAIAKRTIKPETYVGTHTRVTNLILESFSSL